jgi:Flp pilus assembly protein TadB
MPEQLQATINWYRETVEARLRALLKDRDGEAGLGLSLEALVLIGVGVAIALGLGVWLASVIASKQATIAP